MKIIKNNIRFIFGVLIGILISGATVYAINISSNNIPYDNTNSGLESTTVEGAINELYQDASRKMGLNTFGTALYAETLTTMKATATDTSVELAKGKYILVVITNQMTHPQSTASATLEASLNISCDSNTCVKNLISDRTYVKTGTTKYSNTNAYLRMDISVSTYYIEILNDTDTIHYLKAADSSAHTYLPQVYSFQAIPINQ